MSDVNEFSNEPILYELLEYFVKKQEPELIKCKNDAAILPTTGTIKNALRYLNNRYSLPESVTQQVSLTLPWKFAVGDSGRLLAVLQENVIEIRKAKDEYSSVVGKASAPKDAFPQWRKLSWSPDGTILVLASSNGYVSFYNALGNNIFNISPKMNTQNPHVLEAGDAIASMMFLNPRTETETWTYEFILITYSGLLKSYHISVPNAYNLNYEFSFGNFYKNGINAVAYDTKHNLFYVAGNTLTQKLPSNASKTGLTSWRPLNDYPYCKLSFTFDDNVRTVSKFSIWNIIPTLRFQAESIIFKMSISPNSEYLGCLHTDGTVSLWGLPNLIPIARWKLNEQSGFNTPNPLRFGKCKRFPLGLTEFHPLDIGWWSSQAVIIARYSGSISVCSIKNLKNLLGISPEFLAGQPQISELGPNRGFLCLDCETFITSKKRCRESNNEGQGSEVSSESEKEDDDAEPITILSYTTNLVQSTLYSITDIEKFQPKKKKSKVLYRTYRVLGLKSTTPEELYSRKIEIEEYEEAVALANTYNLDTDLVYQTQWRKSDISLNAIQEHLSKVTKRSWVLNECVTRVPDTIEAARELLKFGLRGTNLEAFLSIGDSDNGKLILDSNESDGEDEDERTTSLKQVQRVNQLLQTVDVQSLTTGQKELILYRRKLLHHLDKLLTYEIILSPPLQYSKLFYEEFRQLSAIENAIRFAKDGDSRGVEIMFTYYGDKLFPHWLAIISYFPETLNPLSYEKLLPACDTAGQLFLLCQCELRQKDWCERNEFNEIVYSEDDDRSQVLYEAEPSLSLYKNSPITLDILQKWYKSRACQIERNSFMVDNALQLIKIAKAHNITGLEDLLIDLEILDDLVYNVYLEDISLDQLQKLNDLEKVKLLMSTSNEQSFVQDIKNLLLPFIKRRQQYLGGDLQKHFLNDYLINLSKDNLKLPVKFFEYIKQSHDAEIMQMVDDVAALALDCIYACNDPNMVEIAKSILDSIQKDCNVIRSTTTSSMLEELRREINCVKVLSKYNVKKTLKYVRENKNNPESVKQLFVQMARSLSKLIPSPDEKQWAELLNEMLEIHGLIFSCIDIEICFEICVSARLTSGIKSNIQNCSMLIETKKHEQSLLKVSYEKAVNLILDASKEYFNSAKNLTDVNMELAKACLHLIEDDNEQIKEEYELINSIQILNEFNVKVLPFQVRLAQDRLKLIEHCLNSHKDAYKSRQRLLTLANCLRIEEKNTRIREGKVLELIAKKALEVQDFNVCATTCQQLIEKNYIPAWAISLNLGYCDDFQDFAVRQKCLWFAINNGPSDILGKALKQMHLIEIRMLYKKLELWVPCSEADNENDAESEDEFTDALTTPQVERKEFVPRVLETSTEIVKSSANIMKRSTFGVIKNITDRNFWKSGLKNAFLGTSNDKENFVDSREEKNSDLQSFPSFYESLHNECNISNLDTKYEKYSMPDVENIKLKCCRALLRIATLSEPSNCNIEISDINHLFLQCAKYTFPEDWQLGMAYLLCLNKNSVEEVQTIFMDLPPNELYIQTAAYYYSLELHKKLYKDSQNLYLHDPLVLICKMLTVAQTSEECDVQKALLNLKTLLLHEQELKNVPSLGIKHSNDHNEKELESESSECELDSFYEDNNAGNKIVEKSPCNNSKDIEWTDDWSDFSDEDGTGYNSANTNIPNEIISHKENNKFLKNLDKCTSEEDRFETFVKASNEIKSKESYAEVRNILLEWPKFSNPKFVTVHVHPVLKMIKLASVYASEMNTTDSPNQVFHEYESLVGCLNSIDVLKEFLTEEEDHIDCEHRIYILLCTDDPQLHDEAISIIKQKYKITKLQAPILEALFRKNLTASFAPNHPVYNHIIEHVFTNQSLTDINDNAWILINKLKAKKYLGLAISIISKIENIPPSFRTFDTWWDILMKK